MKKVLLHICCGVCAAHSIDRLKKEGFAVTGYFYNPNIDSVGEHDRRLEAARHAAQNYGIDLIAEPYDGGLWDGVACFGEAEPEGGARCLDCYSMRLKKTLEYLSRRNFDYFTTTLTISPHKNSAAIIGLGRSLCGDRFLPVDFKEAGGFKKTMDTAKALGLYRQNYCGCRYSRRDV